MAVVSFLFSSLLPRGEPVPLALLSSKLAAGLGETGVSGCAAAAALVGVVAPVASAAEDTLALWRRPRLMRFANLLRFCRFCDAVRFRFCWLSSTSGVPTRDGGLSTSGPKEIAAP